MNKRRGDIGDGPLKGTKYIFVKVIEDRILASVKVPVFVDRPL